MKSRLLFGALQSLVAVHTSSAAPIAAGDLLELNACRDASFAAQQLVVRASDSTVRTHLRNINMKLNARSRTQAVAIARRLGVVR